MLKPEKLAALRSRIAALSEDQRQVLWQQLEEQGIDRALVDPTLAVKDTLSKERPKKLPLSTAQAHVWVLHQLYPNLSAYHIPFAWTLQGELDYAVLEYAFTDLLARHESLRTTFYQDEDGRPLQRIHNTEDVPLSMIHESLEHQKKETCDTLSGLPHSLTKRISEYASKPFDLVNGPLMKLVCFQLAANKHVLLVVLHHLIADGWSRGIFIKELSALYSAHVHENAANLPNFSYQYVDHVLAEQAWRDSQEAKLQLSYWQKKLAGLNPLSLPTSYPRPSSATFAAGMQTLILPPQINLQLKTFAQEKGVTHFMLLLATFKLLMFRYSNESDIAVGVPVAGRVREEQAALIGFFVNTLVMRTNFSGMESASFEDWLKVVKHTVTDALAHQELPFADVVEACAPERTAGRNPLFEIMFQAQTDGYRIQNAAMPDVALGNLNIEQHAVSLEQTKFDMSWHLLDRDEGLLMVVEYRTALFDDSFMKRMLGHFGFLLENVLTNSHAPAIELEILSSAERKKLETVSQGKIVSPPETNFLEAFISLSENNPNTIAVVEKSGRSLSYQELERQSAAFASYLISLGIKTESIIGVCLTRSVDLIVTLLGVMRAGAAYLPLDPALPGERLQYMLADADCRYLISEDDLLATLTDFNPDKVNCKVLSADTAVDCNISSLPKLQPHQLAYVIYTSGSSGLPKGTQLHHAGLTHYLNWCIHNYPLQVGQKVPVHGSIGFDATITALFAPLLSGATLNMLTDGSDVQDLADALALNAGVVKVTPAHLQALAPLLGEEAMSSQVPKAFVIGGEALTSQHVEYWCRKFPDVALINEYGPTETVVGCCVHTVTQQDQGNMPIGRPIDGVQLYVLDDALKPQPFGIPGELYIGGPAVARGYLNQFALTAEKFIPDPFAANQISATMYRTGDLACWRDDGVLLYLGRADEQLQINGYRIEPGEIESRLAAHESIFAAAIVERKVVGHAHLVAFVQTDLEESDLASVLTPWLSKTLPDYMVPKHFRCITEMPLTNNGKLDRKSLPQLELNVQSLPIAPRNENEKRLLEVWQQALGQNDFGVEDNYFELGGDSITGMQIVALSRKAGLQLTPAQLFEYQTVAEQARVAVAIENVCIEQTEAPTQAFKLAPIQATVFKELNNINHYNQGMLLRVERKLNIDYMQSALALLLEHHDSLRSVFIEQENETKESKLHVWRQKHIDNKNVYFTLRQHDLSDIDHFDQALRELISDYQEKFNLDKGPLFCAVYFHAHDNENDRLLLLAHHLLVDTVSWRIVLQDLASAYHQLEKNVEPVSLPDKTTSYAAWIQHIDQQSQFENEVKYWQSICAPITALPHDLPSDNFNNLIEGAQSITVSLEQAITSKLINSDEGKSKNGFDKLLLASLSQTIMQWARVQSIVIDVEGHGRQTFNHSFDVSRTVGWFTCRYPLRITTAANMNTLAATKQAFENTPHQGLGYGILRHKGRDISKSPAQISFNYLGRVEESKADTSPLIGIDTTPLPNLIASKEQRNYLFEQVAWLESGCLNILWRFPRAIYQLETMQQLANRQLINLQSFCTVDVETSAKKSISQKNDGVDSESLNKLLNRVGARRG